MTKIIQRVPPVYRLRDYTDDEIEGVVCSMPKSCRKYKSLMTFTK